MNPDDEPPPPEPPDIEENHEYEDESASESERDEDNELEDVQNHLYNPLIPPPICLAPFLLDDPQNNNTTPTITPFIHSESTRKITQV